MAKQMSWDDAYGVTHPESLWLPMFVAFDHLGLTARVVFYGYHDIAALAGGKLPLPGAAKEYVVSGNAYLALAASAPPAGATLLDVVSQSCYDHLADAVLDTPDPSNPAGPKVSFFHAATNFAIPAG